MLPLLNAITFRSKLQARLQWGERTGNHVSVAAMAGKMRGQSEETGAEIGYLRRSIEELKEFSCLKWRHNHR